MEGRTSLGLSPLPDSGLLQLPPEIRNIVFDMVCEDVKMIQIYCHTGHTLGMVEHAILQTCRQLRQEYSYVWFMNGANAAVQIVCSTTNFDIGDIDLLTGWLAALPSLPDGGRREYVLKTRIDNNFEHALRAKQKILTSSITDLLLNLPSQEARKLWCEIVVNFDGKSFDVDFLKHFMRRYTFLDPQIRKALEAAIQRHESKRVGKKENTLSKRARGGKQKSSRHRVA